MYVLLAGEDEFTTMIKILVSYLQLESIALRVDFAWPSALRLFFRGEAVLGGVAQDILSIQCIIGDIVDKKAEVPSILIQIVLVLALVPACFVLWTLWKLAKIWCVCASFQCLPQRNVRSAHNIAVD